MRMGLATGTILVRQLDEAASHVEFVFHRFLSGRDRCAAYSMSLNQGTGSCLLIRFTQHIAATQHHAEDVMSLDGREIRIWPVTLPHHEKVTEVRSGGSTLVRRGTSATRGSISIGIGD